MFVHAKPEYSQTTPSANNMNSNPNLQSADISGYSKASIGTLGNSSDPNFGSKHNHSRGSFQLLDPFAIKISIPPIVLLLYVSYRWYSDVDIRLRRIHSAEERHSELMADLADEINTSSVLKKMTWLSWGSPFSLVRSWYASSHVVMSFTNCVF